MGSKPKQAEAVSAPASATADPQLRELLGRNGLTQAWKDEAGNLHFDPAYVATLNPDTLIFITLEHGQ